MPGRPVVKQHGVEQSQQALWGQGGGGEGTELTEDSLPTSSVSRKAEVKPVGSSLFSQNTLSTLCGGRGGSSVTLHAMHIVGGHVPGMQSCTHGYHEVDGGDDQPCLGRLGQRSRHHTEPV